ncbi:RICIN domain-containing protein [Spirillospora sp. NPDC047279]|uniref:RICIN domain-containing protein n=1 Tax=Spirillospora sp. NPDC047279 TaxID=3155478 RepID=UPI0033FA6F9E
MPRQKWKFTAVTGGYFTVSRGSSTYCLEVTGGSTTARIQQWTCDGRAPSPWRVEPRPPDGPRVKPRRGTLRVSERAVNERPPDGPTWNGPWPDAATLSIAACPNLDVGERPDRISGSSRSWVFVFG